MKKALLCVSFGTSAAGARESITAVEERLRAAAPDRMFVRAFTSIGLDTNFKEIWKSMQGGKVLWLYVVGQMFNILLTLFAVWLLLSGVLFPIPVLS